MLNINTDLVVGDARNISAHLEKESVALSIWSPPYHVGKSYEKDQSYVEWKALLRRVVEAHYEILIPGGFVAINIADILCFPDESMPKIMAENVSRRKRSDITKEAVLSAAKKHPNLSRKEIASLLGCSEQTVDRRLRGNNIRGGKYQTQTRVSLVGGLLESYAMEAGLYLYDRRVWAKDAAWENSRWHTMSYRAVDEFEYVYIFWKPGQTKVDRDRLSREEWVEWGSRAVWRIPSVRANNDHEAKFPIELPRRLMRLLTAENDLVIDPFLGSGTSALAAVDLNRRFFGIDKEPRYVELARSQVRAAQSQCSLPLFASQPR
jgi:DNA modification methylase